MIYVITNENSHLFTATLDKMFELRHEIFVVGRGWSLPTHDNRERDPFDHEDAIYLISLESDGEVNGTIRLIPSKSRHMLQEVFADMCMEGVPVSDSVWEITRGGVKDVPNKRQIWIDLIAACFEYCLIHGVEYLSFVSDLEMFEGWVATGSEITPLGEPVETAEGDIYIAGRLKVTSSWLSQLRKTTGVAVPAFTFIREEFKAA